MSMKDGIQCFVLFSALVIVASVVGLLLPLRGGPTAVEGFQSGNQTLTNAPVSAANQPSLSLAAGSADGSSDQQHLLDNLLKKHDKLIEIYEGRRINPVSATTTQRRGVASTSADNNAPGK